MTDLRRNAPRIDVDALCWELVDGAEASGLLVDMSAPGRRAIGVRIERPYVGGGTRATVPLEIEIPGIDEVMWARGEVLYDHLVARPGAGPMGLMRRTAYTLGRAATRDLRMLEEFVVETARLRESLGIELEVSVDHAI